MGGGVLMSLELGVRSLELVKAECMELAYRNR